MPNPYTDTLLHPDFRGLPIATYHMESALAHHCQDMVNTKVIDYGYFSHRVDSAIQRDPHWISARQELDIERGRRDWRWWRWSMKYREKRAEKKAKHKEFKEVVRRRKEEEEAAVRNMELKALRKAHRDRKKQKRREAKARREKKDKEMRARRNTSSPETESKP